MTKADVGGSRLLHDSKISDWLQIVASVGVLAGLVFVAFQIRESNRIATSEGATSISDQFTLLWISEYETDIHDLFVKSIENPSDLSTAEIRKLSSWYWSNYSIYQRWLNNYELGTARYTGLDELAASVNSYFGHKFGRAWFAQNRKYMDPRIAEVIANELDASPEWTTPPDEEALRLRLLEPDD
jgi:hypothetical protein